MTDVAEQVSSFSSHPMVNEYQALQDWVGFDEAVDGKVFHAHGEVNHVRGIQWFRLVFCG